MKTIIIKSSICVLMTFFAMGMVSDFLLDDKSSELTRTSWKNFSKCLEVENKSCQVVVPPGQKWEEWGIALR